MAKLRVVTTLGGVYLHLKASGVDEVEACIRELLAITKDEAGGTQILDDLAAETPFLAASQCESLLQAYLITDNQNLKLICLQVLLTIAISQVKSKSDMEPIIHKMALISIVLIAKQAPFHDVKETTETVILLQKCAKTKCS